MPDLRLKLAVFIDFDNIEIGVKNTLNAQFDIGVVLEALKERGDVVSKTAYGDWTRAGDYSRSLTQHATKLVQRNLTPGGDKNGADINLALDALEMAFTHTHISGYVIVGGDSDFISLVEKLKQYGRKVIVVGGRQFTSLTMQKNCHEFIAYENLGGARSGRSGGRGEKPTGAPADVSKVLPLVKRALKVLSEREVAPQLGLLKSTLLQLDSTFSEREYGANSFRDFMEKVAQTGAVTLKNAGRSMMVESRENGEVEIAAPQGEPAPVAEMVRDDDRRPHDDGGRALSDPTDDEESLPQSPMTMQDGIRAVQHAFAQASPPPRWPMYVRQAKQFLKTGIEGFDERKYGFASVVDLFRAAGKEGVVRLERDRHGAVRVFPGPKLTPAPAAVGIEDVPLDVAAEVVKEQTFAAEPVEESPIVDAETIELTPAVVDADAAPARKGARKRRTTTPRPKASKSETGETGGKSAKPRARKTTRSKSEAADKS